MSQETNPINIEFKKGKPRNFNSSVNAVVLGLESTNNEPDSKQIYEDPFRNYYGTGDGDAIEPPIDLLFWATRSEYSTTLRSTIETKVQNTVGSEWDIVPIEDSIDIDKKEEAIIRDQKIITKKLFNRPNPEMAFTEILVRMGIDEESTGNGYIEVGRDREGKINYIGHIPSHTIRVRCGVDNGYIQIRGTKKRYFKRFGDRRVMHMETGRSGGRVSYLNTANELIQFVIYTPRNSYYGIPRYISAGPAIRGNYLAQLYNIYFFENNATPRIIITISGGSLSPSSLSITKDYFKSGKGVKNAGRALILQGEKRTQRNQPDNSKIEIHKLTIGQTEDASWLNYQNFNNSEIREAFRISGVLTGQIDNVPKTNALIARQITNEQVFKPEKSRKEYIINTKLLDDILGIDRLVQFKFDDIPPVDPITKSRVDRTYSGIGGISIDDARDILGLKRYNKEWSKLPFQFGLENFKSDMAVDDSSSDSSNTERNNNPRNRNSEPQEE